MDTGIVMKEVEKVPGASVTFTITSLIEGVWFGLGTLLIPGVFLQMVFLTDGSSIELYFFRSIGVLCLALAAGCWYARTGNRGEVKMMSLIMSIAKVGTTVVLILMMIETAAQPIGYLNPVLTAFLAVLNVRQYMITK